MKPTIMIWALPILMLIIGVELNTTKNQLKKDFLIGESVQKTQIAFLSFDIYEKPNGELTLELLDKIIVDGELKNELLDLKSGGHGDLTCLLLDENSNLQTTKYISNPLKKSLEYVNDSGELLRKEVVSEHAQLSIRLQLKENTKYILINQIDTLTTQNSILFTSEIH